jgi:glucokinase
MTVIGIDVGGTTIKAGLIVKGRIVKRFMAPTQTRTSKQVIAALNECINALWQDDIKTIGIGIPGVVDRNQGVVIKTSNLPLYHIFIQEQLQREWQRSVIIDNDANCFALAHTHHYEVPVLLGITLGTGFGSGLVLDGVIYRGSAFASEIAKVPWHSTHISTERAEDIISKQGIISLADAFGIHINDPKELFDMAATAQNARRVFEVFGDELGKVLATAHMLYDPDVIVIGGNIAGAWRYFAKPMKSSLSQQSYFRVPKVVRSPIKDAGILGAGMLL